jgi:anti-sigma factor RsiW
MEPFLRDILEEYLAGHLTPSQKAQVEDYLVKHPAEVEELEQFQQISFLLAELRLPQGKPVEPEAGFYARVLQCIDAQREEPFWMFFLRPVFVRRLAFASLMWLAAVGAYVVSFNDFSGDANRRMAEAVLTDRLATDYYRVRLGTDLQQNRDSMLAVVMTSED